jgi:hypothetical protein
MVRQEQVVIRPLGLPGDLSWVVMAPAAGYERMRLWPNHPGQVHELDLRPGAKGRGAAARRSSPDLPAS